MKSLTFKKALGILLVSMPMMGAASTTDSLTTQTISIDTLVSDSVNQEAVTMKYDQRVHRYRKNWGALIPTQTILQTCGNMGLFSVGIGWDYGKRRQWETQLLFGFIPKFQSHRTKLTMTLKENYIPWSVKMKKGWSFEPLECGLYFNTVIGHEFWTTTPSKYGSGYYQFSTRIRPNIFLGERFSVEIPKSKRKFVKGLTFFYELSTNDIYVMRLYHDGGKAEFWDIFGLSFGIKTQLF